MAPDVDVVARGVNSRFRGASLNGGADALPFRVAPHNLEAEQALLGAILIDNRVLDRVSSFLGQRHFHDPLHGKIYAVASKLIADGKQATPITLKTYFESAEPIDAAMPVTRYLGHLAANAPTHHERPRLWSRHLRPGYSALADRDC
jgi:replicative DNA helicase